ncbi:MAG: hypothetical protein U0T84_10325 [Chitinophagales bacterium]
MVIYKFGQPLLFLGKRGWLFFLVCLLSVLVEGSSSQIDSVLRSSKKVKPYALFAYGADCANCYVGWKFLLKQESAPPDVIVFNSVPRRVAKRFVEVNFGITADSSVLIFDTAVWRSCLDTVIGSRMAVWQGQKMSLPMNITEYGQVLHKRKISGLKYVDSIDISKYYGGPLASVHSKGANYVVFDNLLAELNEIDASGAVVHKFQISDIPVPFLKAKFIDKILSRGQIDTTIKQIESGKSPFVNGKYTVTGSYVTSSYIYVSLSAYAHGEVKGDNNNELIIQRLYFLARFDHNWKFIDVRAFPECIDESCHFVTDIDLSHFLNDTIFAMRPVNERRDSLVILFNLGTSGKYEPTSFAGFKPEPYSARPPKEGWIQFQISKYVKIEGQWMVHLGNENHLHSFDGRRTVLLEGIPTDLRLKVFMQCMYVEDQQLMALFIYTDSTSHLCLNTYSLKDFHLINQTNLDCKNLKEAYYEYPFLNLIEADDDRAILKKYARIP